MRTEYDGVDLTLPKQLYLHSFVFLYKSREPKAPFYEPATYLLSVILRPFSLLDHKLVNNMGATGC